MFTFVGHSGSGKSTVFKVILGEEDISSGHIFRDTVDVESMSERELLDHRRKTGVVFQSFRLLEKKNGIRKYFFCYGSIRCFTRSDRSRCSLRA